MVQKQWLNLYLFDINNFTIYKILYYLSGLIVPIFVIINSLNKFTYYKFNYYKKINTYNISGKLLFLITIILCTTLSVLISQYIFINIKIILNFFMNNNDYLVQLNIDKQILFVVIISTFLVIEKTKYILKKIILTNFFIFSIFTWYAQISNPFLVEIVPSYIFQIGNINYINIAILLAIEALYYLWSYFSYGSYLSDWSVPKLYKKEVLPIINISMFYLLIILYYSILFK